MHRCANAMRITRKAQSTTRMNWFLRSFLAQCDFMGSWSWVSRVAMDVELRPQKVGHSSLPLLDSDQFGEMTGQFILLDQCPQFRMAGNDTRMSICSGSGASPDVDAFHACGL